jgi:hypothetical protein
MPVRRCAVALVVSVVACGGGGGGGGDGGGGDARPPDAIPPGLANVWIDQYGGTCTVSTTLIAYEGAGDASSCPDFDAAWDAMSSGQIARVIAGTYGPQLVTGDKDAETWIVGASKATTIVSGTVECFDPPEFGSSSALCAVGDYLTVENLTLDSGPDESNPSSSARPDGEHVTFRDVDFVGGYPNIYITGPYFTWQRGSHGADGVTPPPRRCDRSYGQPVWVVAPNVTLDGIRFNVKRIEAGAGPYCGPDDTPHLETIRIESEGTDLVVESSWFVAGSDAGSGHLFTSVSPTGLVLRNNVFEPVNGTYAMQGSVGSGAVFAYNTFHQGLAITEAGSTWIGNLGAYSGCEGTHTRNVWEGTGSCGTDTFVDTQDLGIGDGGHLEQGSPAIDAGELPGADDYCTHQLGAVDRDGDVRPRGTACDAGADEQ